MADEPCIPHYGMDLHLHGGSIWRGEKGRFEEGEITIQEGIITDIHYGSKLPLSSSRGIDSADLGGGYLVPSFLDSHMHLMQWSISRNGIDLSLQNSLEDIVKMLEDVINERTPNTLFKEKGLIFGTDYDESKFSSDPYFDGKFLQREFPEIPVVIRRVCGHKALANKAGLNALDMNDEICKNGIILDDPAMRIPWKIDLTTEERSKFLDDAMISMYEHGVTGGVEIIPTSILTKFQETISNTRSGMDLSLSLIRDSDVNIHGHEITETWDDETDRSDPYEQEPPIIFEKFFLDGSIGSRTASFNEDFLDQKSVFPIYSDGHLEEMINRSNDDSLIPMVHCIGDRAISQAISICERSPSVYRLEHAESITDIDLKRMTTGKGALCLQPNFQYLWGSEGGLYHNALGDAGLKMNRFRHIMNSGLDWCFGTDMMPPGPLFAMQGALYHHERDQRLTLPEAISGFNSKAAELSVLKYRHSSNLEIGRKADAIVIDNNFIKILLTIRKGCIVYKMLDDLKL